MFDSFSSLALSHFNGRADVLHQKGMIKCLGSVAEAVSGNDSLHLFFEKGRLANKQSRCKASSGGEKSPGRYCSRESSNTACAVDETPESDFLPSRIPLPAALRKRCSNPAAEGAV